MAYKNPREWAGARPWRVEDDLVMAASKSVYRIETTIKPRTKSDTFRIISENTELTKRQVSDVFEALGAIFGFSSGRSAVVTSGPVVTRSSGVCDRGSRIGRASVFWLPASPPLLATFATAAFSGNWSAAGIGGGSRVGR